MEHGVKPPSLSEPELPDAHQEKGQGSEGKKTGLQKRNPKYGEWKTRGERLISTGIGRKSEQAAKELKSLCPETTHLTEGATWGVSVASCALLCLLE